VALGGFGAVFVILVFVHARVEDAIERASAALRYHERGLARVDLAWDRLPVTSERFASRDHPYTGDLDVFGRASLMQIVDATETSFGEAHLARLLSLEEPGTFPVEVAARQEAVRELALRPEFREALATAGAVLAGERPDPAPMLDWSEGTDRAPTGLAWMAWLVPIVVGILALVGPALRLRATTITSILLVQLVWGLAASFRVSRVIDAVSARESAVTRWRRMLVVVEAASFRAPFLNGLRRRLLGDGRPASQEIAALERIVGFADARRNEVFRFLIGPFLMWDAHCALALLRWRARAGPRLRGCLDALGEVEAVASLAGFAFEHPDFAWPELSEHPVLEARALGHPLIPSDRRVDNDVRLPAAGRALVVTGSNMSGKSTLLRALGVNVVLANAGAPVCAAAMRIGPARVATSMRVTDSLAQNVSHFYAELKRLKRVLDFALDGTRAPVLFLFDEILHGTNSRERIAGAHAIIGELLSRGAMGAASTHDLGIASMADDLSGKVANVHFEEQVHGDVMTFDYILRPGVVRSSNALRLMRAVGIVVPEDS
jgi:DNA mismatch repair ATPase MutS